MLREVGLKRVREVGMKRVRDGERGGHEESERWWERWA